MSEPLKHLLEVVIVVIIAIALIAFVRGGEGSFITTITDKISNAISQIGW